MITYEGAVMLARVAVPVTWGIGVALTLAVSGAMVEAVYPRWGTWVWASVKTGLSVALGVLSLVTVGVAVTYLHTYASDKGTGRHFPGWGRARQYLGYPGRHAA